MKWLQELWNRIVTSNDADIILPYKIKIDTQTDVIRELNKELGESLFEKDNLFKLLGEKEEVIADLTEQLDSYRREDIHHSLENFKMYLDTIEPKAQYYDFGKGKKRVHTIFADALKEKAMVEGFLVGDMGINPLDYPDADTMIFDISYRFRQKYPTSKYYAFDTELYGQTEYWALPSETINKLRKKDKSFDCDDKMVLLFAIYRVILDKHFPQDSWRLRGFIVDLWAAGGHALLTWVSKKHNDWVALETTYMDIYQSKISNYRVRDQLFYQIRYSFDEKEEYVKL